MAILQRLDVLGISKRLKPHFTSKSSLVLIFLGFLTLSLNSKNQCSQAFEKSLQKYEIDVKYFFAAAACNFTRKFARLKLWSNVLYILYSDLFLAHVICYLFCFYREIVK